MGLIPYYTKTTTPWRRIIQRLLPEGPIWDLASQPELAATADVMVQSIGEAHNAVRLMVLQAFPWTITYLLDEWIRVLGLPGPCVGIPLDVGGKRALIAGRLAAQGGQTPAYYVGIAAAMDVGIEIVEQPRGFPSRFGSARFGTSRFGYEGQVFEWLVKAPSSTPAERRAQLECVIRAFAPSHTVLSFEYTL